MRLLKSLAYIDPIEVEWIAPKGWVVDGASIPKFAWSIIGGPFEGKYRDASVIHDVACDQKIRPWEDVHEVFHFAMLCSGVTPLKAHIMYAAVYHFGPRWERKLKISAGFNTKSARSSVRLGPSSKRIADFTTPSVSRYGNDIRKIKNADLVVTVKPPRPRLSMVDFKKLKTLIEKRGSSKKGAMSLAEIRDYRP